MAFHTIHSAPGLSHRERVRAHRSGPWAVASAHPPGELLGRAGFDDVTAADLTDDFRTVAKAWIDQWEQHRAALVELYGDTDFEARQHDRRVQLQAIDDGLLQRSLLVGSRPSD